jgi:hypothetical protein
MPGITNFPALLDSLTASLKSSSKNADICFFDTGFSGVLTLSLRCAMIFDLLKGVAIEFFFPPQILIAISDLSTGMPPRTIAVLADERKRKTLKNPDKMGISLPSVCRNGL